MYLALSTCLEVLEESGKEMVDQFTHGVLSSNPIIISDARQHHHINEGKKERSKYMNGQADTIG